MTVECLFARLLKRFKIRDDPATPEMIRHEIQWALANKINFGILGTFTWWLYERGWLRIYLDINDYGLIYAVAIVPVLLLALDAYFYWLHYAMHFTRFAPWSRHDVHHGADNVTAWSAFSVHPIEGFLEILSRPLILFLIPLHPYSIVAFLLVTFALNIIGHSGYEFFPASYATNPLTRCGSCATFHYMHHQDGRYNLSLFFNHWDRIMGTVNPEYESFYERVKAAQVAGGRHHGDARSTAHA